MKNLLKVAQKLSQLIKNHPENIQNHRKNPRKSLNIVKNMLNINKITKKSQNIIKNRRENHGFCIVAGGGRTAGVPRVCCDVSANNPTPEFLQIFRDFRGISADFMNFSRFQRFMRTNENHQNTTKFYGNPEENIGNPWKIYEHL